MFFDILSKIFYSAIPTLFHFFGEKDRVLYTILLENDPNYQEQKANAQAQGNLTDFLPWEYVQEKEDRGRIDLNYGAVSCNGDYAEDIRLYMFVQREDGSVKPAGQITGGYLENTYETGSVYLQLP